jgi:hypothetical protein
MRQAMSFKVDFHILPEEESVAQTDGSRENITALAGSVQESFPPDPACPENAALSDLMPFLMNLDNKLDRILALLSGSKQIERTAMQGICSNISGSGMEIIVDNPVESGRFIRTKFFLSKYPLTFLDLLGRIVRVTLLEEKGASAYSLGISFINIAEADRETIINHVFRKQREKLRRRNNLE